MKFFLCSIFAVLLFQNVVTACSVSFSPDVPYSYFIAKTNIIFLAEVVEKYTVLKEIKGEKFPVHYYKINIIETVKGKKRKSLSFHLSEYRTSMCESTPPKLYIGEKWIIFGDYDEGKADGIIRNLYGASLYSRWINYSKTPGNYEEVLKSVKNPVTTIQGEIDETDNPGSGGFPAKNIEISIEGETFRSKTRTDEKGRYIFSGIPPGKYKITIHLNYEASNTVAREEITKAADNYRFTYEEIIREGDSEYKYFNFLKFPAPN